MEEDPFSRKFLLSLDANVLDDAEWEPDLPLERLRELAAGEANRKLLTAHVDRSRGST